MVSTGVGSCFIESSGFKVVAFGATPNRKFFMMHGSGKLIYKTSNIYSDDPGSEIRCTSFTENHTNIHVKCIVLIVLQNDLVPFTEAL